MNRPLRIVAADDEPAILNYYEAILPYFGHRVVGVASTGPQLVKIAKTTEPDLILTDIRMPGLDGLEAIARIYEHRPVPVIIVSGYHDQDLVDRASAEHVVAYLLKPITQATLEAEIVSAMRRFDEFEAVRSEAAHNEQALADRKVIERAREIIMRQSGLGEAEAFQQLQRTAAERRKPLVKVAQSVLKSAHTLDI